MLRKNFALALLIGGLALAGVASAADQAAAEAAVTAAKAAQKAAAAVGGEWRDTGEMIEAAEKAAAEGNYGNAVELAEKAREQGVLGKEQALSQQSAGNPKYLYN